MKTNVELLFTLSTYTKVSEMNNQLTVPNDD